jgi:hypothetical protein
MEATSVYSRLSSPAHPPAPKRPREDGGDDNDNAHSVEDDEEVRADQETIAKYAAVLWKSATSTKAKGLSKSDFTNRAIRVDPIKRRDDDRVEILSGYALHDGLVTYLLAADFLDMMNHYEVGDRDIYAHIPLQKVALNASIRHDHELSRSVDECDLEHKKNAIQDMRAAFLTDEARQLYKNEKDMILK